MAAKNSSHSLNRRGFLKLSGLVAGAGMLAACAAPVAPAAAPAAGGNAAAATPAGGKTSILVWYQDWDGANRIMKWVEPEYKKTHPDVDVQLQPIGFGDLLAKMLPSIASGTEADVMMMYTDWIVGTDVTQVFLDITDAAGGASQLQEKMWPAAFQVVSVPDNKVYYLPWLAGIRGAAHSVNTDQLKEKGIDYTTFKTYEEVIDAGKTLTQTGSDGKITRSGYSIRNSQYQILWSLIWQMGGKFFDKEKGVWQHSTDEGEAAAQILYDIYWKEQTCDFNLFTEEYNAVSQKLVSIWADGAWTASAQTDVAGIPAQNFATPPLANAKEYVLYPQHIAGWGCSKRLVDSADKLQASVDFALLIVGSGASLQALDFYSGVVPSKEVYNDPNLGSVKYGEMSKRVAEAMWPVARYPQDHVADQTPASQELDRAMRKEIPIKQALANMDSYLQDQENQARERLGMS